MPGLHRAADAASLVGQRRYVRAVAARAVLAVFAAAAALLGTDTQIGSAPLYVVAGAFFIALVIEALVWVAHPERTWYDGRALAESSKSLTWRFAVGAQPYPIDDASSESRFLNDLKALIDDAPPTGIWPTSDPVISDNVRALRASPLAARRDTYMRDRIDDQCSWYMEKAKVNAKRSMQFRVLLVVAEFLAVLVAFARAQNIIRIDLAGLFAAAIAGAASWAAIRQHESLARAYTFAQLDLVISRERLRTCANEHAWAAEAADAEEAISREHTMWRASRTSSRY